MNLLSVLLNIAFRSMAGFIPSGRAKSKVILLFVMAVVTLGWMFTLTFRLRVFYEGQPKTLLIIWQRIARTPFAYPEPAVVSVQNHSSNEDNETVTSDNVLSSVMDVQHQEDGDVPALISDVPDDDDANDDDDDDDMDDADSCDEIDACLHADYHKSEEDPILGPRKRPQEDDDSPDLFSKLLCPQDSGGSVQSFFSWESVHFKYLGLQ